MSRPDATNVRFTSSRLTLLAFAVAVLWALCAPLSSLANGGETPPQPKILAWVNEEPITDEEFLDILMRQHEGRDRKTDKFLDYQKLLDQIINVRLLVQEALRLELDKDVEVKTHIDDFADSTVLELFQRREVKEKINLTDEDVRAYFGKLFEKVHVRQIVVNSLDEADKVMGRLKDGADFAELARELSAGPKAEEGGDLGTFPMYSIYPPLQEGVFDLKVGEVSKPIHGSGSNYHIVRLEERIPADEELYGHAKANVEKKLFAKREKEKTKEIVDALKEKSTIEMRNEVVESIKRDDIFNNKDLRFSTETLALVNDETVTLGKFFRKLSETMRLRTVKDGEFPEFRQQVLDLLIGQTLVLQEAKRMGLEDDHSVQLKVTERARDVLARKFISRVIWPQVEIGAEEMEEYYKEHNERYRGPGRIRLARLSVSSEDKAKELREKASGGTDFAWLVIHNSKDEEKLIKKGGDVGWSVIDSDFPESIRVAVADLPKGGISQPVKSGDSYYIYRVLDKEEGRVPSLEEVKQGVRNDLAREKLQAKIEEWFSRLREASEIKFNEDEVKKFFGGSQSQ